MEMVPLTWLGLFSTLMVSLLALVTWMVKSALNNQAKITNVLDNHLGEIGTHMARTNAVLADIKDVSLTANKYMATTSAALAEMQGRLLDAALRRDE